jgi:hypothetical protein
MKIDAFLPAPNGTVLIVVGVASAFTPLPAPGEYLRLFNAGTAIVFVELSGNGNAAGVGAPAASVTTSLAIPIGGSVTVRRTGSLGVSTISGTAAQPLYVAAGDGGV